MGAPSAFPLTLGKAYAGKPRAQHRKGSHASRAQPLPRNDPKPAGGRGSSAFRRVPHLVLALTLGGLMGFLLHPDTHSPGVPWSRERPRGNAEHSPLRSGHAERRENHEGLREKEEATQPPGVGGDKEQGAPASLGQTAEGARGLAPPPGAQVQASPLRASPRVASSEGRVSGREGPRAAGVPLEPPRPLRPEEDPFIRRIIVRPSELARALQPMAPGRPVVGTMSNLAFRDMLQNWHLNVLKAGMGANCLVAALDKQTHEFCVSHGMPTILLHTDLPSTDFRKSASVFKEMGTMKTAFVLSVLESGWDLIMSDTDTVWMKDPTDFFRRSSPLGAADVMVTTDSVSHQNDVKSQKNPWRVMVHNDLQGWYRYATPRAREIFGNAYEHAFNTGVLFLRRTNATLRFASDWHEVMRTRGKSLNMTRVWGDQHAFNELHRMSFSMFPIQVYEPPDDSSPNNRIFWTNHRKVKLAVLPAALFCNGHVFFVQQLPKKLQLEPFVVHNTFQFYYGPGKVARFRHFGLWLLDPPEYYTEGNFLSVSMTLPPRVLNMQPGPEKHSAALSYYYEGLRNAFAIARILNRKLIFPYTTCFCDRYWFTLTEPCRSPGADEDPPFECPIDHLVDLSFWTARPSTMAYRPSNFLAHPSVPREVKESRWTVEIVPREDGTSGAEKPSGVVALPELASEHEIRNALGQGEAAKTRVLHIDRPHKVFCRHSQEDQDKAFDLKTYRLFHIEWCCLPGYKPPEWPRFKSMNITIPKLTMRTLETCRQLED